MERDLVASHRRGMGSRLGAGRRRPQHQPRVGQVGADVGAPGRDPLPVPAARVAMRARSLPAFTKGCAQGWGWVPEFSYQSVSCGGGQGAL